jgi:hypothetical protein
MDFGTHWKTACMIFSLTIVWKTAHVSIQSQKMTTLRWVFNKIVLWDILAIFDKTSHFCMLSKKYWKIVYPKYKLKGGGLAQLDAQLPVFQEFGSLNPDAYQPIIVWLFAAACFTHKCFIWAYN